jgi:hypothetical protein
MNQLGPGRDMIHHDSTFRTDWFPFGFSTKGANFLADHLEKLYADELKRGAATHSGRRAGDRDYIKATSPRGWAANHDGPATIKVRGCAAFRKLMLSAFGDLGPPPLYTVYPPDRRNP